MPLYRLHDHTGDDLGTIEHVAGNLEDALARCVDPCFLLSRAR
jgi:hypothetical protein